MPLKNDFVRANRLDLAKVVERWGGLPQLAEVIAPPFPPPQSAHAACTMRGEARCYCDSYAAPWNIWHSRTTRASDVEWTAA